MKLNKNNKGFSLLEIIIAMVLLSVLSSITLELLGPWLSFRAKLETENRLEQIRTGFEAAYNEDAFRIDSDPANRLVTRSGTLFPSVLVANPDAGGQSCQTNLAALSRWVRTDPERLKRDGWANEICIEIFGGFSDEIDGFRMPYHYIVIYSPGRNGRRDLVPVANPAAGTLAIDLTNGTPNTEDDFDDLVVVLSGFDIQKEKYLETKKRLDKVADMHETYFVQRFLSNPSRDISINYFCRANGINGYDNSPNTEGQLNEIVCTAPNVWQELGIALTGLGFSNRSTESKSAWEQVTAVGQENLIEVSMRAGTQNGMTIKSPDSNSSPPYTVMYRARVPGVDGGGNPNYMAKVVAGRY